MSNQINSTSVDVVCDLRELNADVDDIGTVHNLWQKVGQELVGQPLSSNQSLRVNLPEGNVILWVVDAHDVKQVQEDTSFQIVDLLRSPKLFYQCQVCNEYGPLRCVTCEQEWNETRLCSKHAHTIKDELSAYCPDHIPICNCRSNCTHAASFRCRRCHKLFGEHFHRHHPNDSTIDYCHLCYRILFEQCASGCGRLGKSKCAYQTSDMEAPCGNPLCAEHSYQWKIWGPHNRGVTLCEHHMRLLGSTEPADLLFMMLTAKAPYVRRGKRQSLPNPFRLRRIINRNRSTKLTFSQLGYILQTLESQVANWGRRAERNYRYLSKNYFETTQDLTQAESTLLSQIRVYYQQILGGGAAQQITNIEIVDRYYKPGQPPRYRVQLHVNTADRGAFIGRGGATIRQICQQLNIEIDLIPGA